MFLCVRLTRVLGQHVAAFGESGKTVMLSALYGAAHEPEFLKSSPFRIVAEDTGLGGRLHKNYLGGLVTRIPGDRALKVGGHGLREVPMPVRESLQDQETSTSATPGTPAIHREDQCACSCLVARCR